MCALIGRVSKPTPSVFHRETGRFSPHFRSTTLSISPQKTRHSNNNIFSCVVSAPPCEPTINSSDDNSCVEFDSLVTRRQRLLYSFFFFNFHQVFSKPINSPVPFFFFRLYPIFHFHPRFNFYFRISAEGARSIRLIRPAPI